MKIGYRLALAFGLTLGLMMGVVALALFQARALHDSLRYYDTGLVPSIRTIHTVLEGIGTARRHEGQHLLSDGADAMTDLENKVQQDRAQVESSLKDYDSLLSDAEDRADYEKLKAAAFGYWQMQDQVLAVSRLKANPVQRDAAVKMMLGDSRKAYYALTDASLAWAKHNEQLGNALARKAEERYQRDIESLLALTGAALLLAALAAVAISRSITQPLREAVELAKSVARGDLTRRVEASSNDEVGALLVALNDMSTQLASLITDVFRSAEAVGVTAGEIAQSNEELSVRTQQQAGSLEETAASMEEITSIGKNNSDNAGNADRLAREAQELAETGGSVVSQAVSAMGAINDCSSKISNIISVIDDIAFQTNLLALNAAVEAARAGEQGRGFAVVATEVRGLAQRSADAAKQIKALINDSAEKVRAGTELVDRSGQALSKILISVRQMTSLITEISGWSQEQSQGVARMNEAILHLDGATQLNAALVEQGSAASRTLQGQADALSQRASFFRLEEKFGYRKADRAPSTTPVAPAAPVASAAPMSAAVPMRKAS